MEERETAMITKLFSALGGLLLCTATASCVIVDDDRPSPTSYGTLTAFWTLDGSAHPSVCSFYAVDRVDVAVYDDAGFFVADAQPLCEDFGISFDVATGWYETEMTLLDFDGFAVSDTVIVDDLRVLRDTEVIVDVDFPDSTIY